MVKEKPAKNSRRKVLGRFQAVVSALRGSAQRGRTAESRILEKDQPGALAILAEGPDREALRVFFRDAGWELAIAGAVSAALARYKKHPLPIILCDREVPGCEWHKAVSILASLPGRPLVILLSSRCDQNLWDDVTTNGGSDILRVPLDRYAVERAVRSGWLLWRHLQRLRRATASHL